jgi:hypothetical protein
LWKKARGVLAGSGNEREINGLKKAIGPIARRIYDLQLI